MASTAQISLCEIGVVLGQLNFVETSENVVGTPVEIAASATSQVASALAVPAAGPASPPSAFVWRISIVGDTALRFAFAVNPVAAAPSGKVCPANAVYYFSAKLGGERVAVINA